MNNRKGFTLIELLVVISIIALLLSVLMPALSKAKNQAKNVVCMSNLRQWGIAATTYANENDNKMIADYDQAEWIYELKPYLGLSTRNDSSTGKRRDINICPMTKPRYDFNGAPSSGFGRGPLSAWGYYPGDGYLGGMAGSYGFNCWVYDVEIRDMDGSHALKKSWKTFNVKQGYKIPLIGGCYRYAALPEAWDNPPAYEVDAEFVGMGSYCVNRHNGYTNMVFLDGSTRSIGLKELWTLLWHREYKQDWETRTVRGSIDWPDWMKGFKDYF